jgi:tetratricopeptide (TPR) repeat protein
MAIDDKDFIWLTSNSLTVAQRKNYMTSKSSTNAPIKRLNPSGLDVLSRQGTYAPGGDLLEVSSLIDVAVKDNGIYSLLDDSRNRIFTYDSGGNLLYAFGGTGTQDGCMTLASALAYLGDDLIALDMSDNVIVRYSMTEYAYNIQNALLADDEKDFEGSLKYWGTVLEENQNLELAYKALGNSYLRNGYYKEAMEYYKNADDKEGYSKAYQYVRADYVQDHFGLVVGIIVLILAVWLVFKKWVDKENQILYAVGTKQTLKSELLYAYRAIYHPFDGFWEIKMQQRGSVRSASVILAMVVLSFCYQEIGTGYLFRTTRIEEVDLFIVILTVLIPLLLWCLASWGLTTLFEGKGSMKDIYVMTCYSLFPVFFTNIITTIMSNGMVLAEQDFMTFISSLGFVWMAGLIFAGSMVIHDYHFNKNVTMVIASIVGIAVIMFLALLFVNVGQKMIEFFIGIYEEIIFRT